MEPISVAVIGVLGIGLAAKLVERLLSKKPVEEERPDKVLEIADSSDYFQLDWLDENVINDVHAKIRAERAAGDVKTKCYCFNCRIPKVSRTIQQKFSVAGLKPIVAKFRPDPYSDHMRELDQARFDHIKRMRELAEQEKKLGDFNKR